MIKERILTMNDSPASQRKSPGIGVAIVVWSDDERKQLLLGLGHNAVNRNEIYAVPGGHWESGETLIEAVRRETAEEAGVEVRNLRLISVYEFFNAEKNKSYVTIGFEGILANGIPEVREPENKADWGWYSAPEALEHPLFAPDKILIERALSGLVYEAVD
jgi:ADP-ribose pyrophosphatase YjhB (NUDIX family)